VLSGWQVAVVAPTTVLVRQHLGTFRRRFTRFDKEVAGLSRLVTPADARAAKQGLSDGSIDIVIGTHALAGAGVHFKKLGLLIIDEEQRFGTRIKQKLRSFADGVHILTLSATPIPRTLQGAMVGLHSLSLLQTPPARRLPIQTVLAPFQPGVVRQALLSERNRRGQSFVVCPRIEDIEPMAAQLRDIVPDLHVKIVHGKIPAVEIDEIMVAFANGEGDVLLATNIVESGLDLPRANTMLVWRPDRFGGAQLHQLRGRVGRGRRRGLAYLLTDPGEKLAPATEKRLRLLTELDRLGAGLAISRRDMDMRGAGDLIGEEQTGHIRLIGIDLYRDLLDRALARASGDNTADDWRVELNVDIVGAIPNDYVADPEVRINLYAKLARLRDPRHIGNFADEIEDRFGEPPPPVRPLLELARAREIARQLGVRRLDAGPRAIGLSFEADHVERWRKAVGKARNPDRLRWTEDRLVYEQPTESDERMAVVIGLLERLES
jgi:transcription-repair coupling factor (superfamily II helicase)